MTSSEILEAIRDLVAGAEEAGWDVAPMATTLNSGRDAYAALRDMIGGIDEVECCLACGHALQVGDKVLLDASGELIHRDCCGPEREAFTGKDGRPLKDGEPLPEGWPWRPHELSDERLREMIGQNTPTRLPSGGEMAAVVRELQSWRGSDRAPPADMLIRYPNGSVAALMFYFALEGDDIYEIAREQGFELRGDVLDEVDEPELYRRYFEEGEGEEVIRDWTPKIPEGWKLAGKWDTDDGPAVFFLRSREVAR